VRRASLNASEFMSYSNAELETGQQRKLCCQGQDYEGFFSSKPTRWQIFASIFTSVFSSPSKLTEQ
jgi:hypothetical protein